MTLRKAAGATPLNYLIYYFSGVAIKSWELNCKENDLPEETISFNIDFTLHLRATNSDASQSSNSGCDGRLP